LTRQCLTIVILFVVMICSGQPFFPEDGPVYTADEIPEVHIAIDPDSLNILYLEENWYSDHEYPATFVFESDNQVDEVSPVGFRFRGNTARDKMKKSFKVSFNTFTEGGNYLGLEKLNLNAEVNDPAMLRSRLCWDLYRRHGVPAPRSNHVEVYINDEYYGLYLNTEHIDEEFCELRFGSKGGNLYKCRYPANLDYISNNPDDYKMAPWGDRTYELKTNREADDYSDLAEFIGFLNLASNEELECRLSEYFNVYAYLKVAAIDVLTGNWDGYIYNQNNYYLYHNPTTDQFEYIPYDTDNTWGIDWLDRDWSDRNLYNWSQTGAQRPLFNRLMDISYYRDIFTWYVEDILEHSYFTAEHESQVQSLHAFIEVSALADPYRPLDWSFSNEDFLNALDQGSGGHVDFGVLEFAEIRKSSALNQLESVTISGIPAFVVEDFEHFPQHFEVELHSEGPDLAQLDLIYSIDGVSQETSVLSGSQESYLFDLDLPEEFEILTYNLILTSVQGETHYVYCEDRSIFNDLGPYPVINEVMSANQSTVSDEAGEFDDWVEIYNPGAVSINLEDYYLTDNSTSPTKWHFPDYDLEPGAFLIVWADRDLHQGSMHANFRLDAQGEEVFLFKGEAEGIRYIDGIDIPSLPDDYSYGRETDAELPWVLFWAPTPGQSNSGSLSTSEIYEDELLIHPNPTNRFLYLPEFSNYTIITAPGRKILSGVGRGIDVSSLPSGVYIVKFNGQVARFVKE